MDAFNSLADSRGILAVRLDLPQLPIHPTPILMLYDVGISCGYSLRATTADLPTKRAPNEPARPICAQKSIFLDKNGYFWAKHPNYVGREQKFWYPSEQFFDFLCPS